ncbi:hypothetical protein LK08_29290 [Streptomyces sp. MUSC 125]|nr:hypothetical protein LK08_29290 [Streptomyces sp. MUSC 125]
MSLSSSSGQRPVGGKDSRSGSCVAVVAAPCFTHRRPVCHICWQMSPSVSASLTRSNGTPGRPKAYTTALSC